MSSKTVPEAWWCDVLCDWISNTTSDKRTSMKALASVHAVRYLSQRLLHFQGWQEKKWLTRSMNMLLKKCVTVARNLNIDSNSADLVSISFGVIKILQETCKPNLIFKCSKCGFITVHRNTNHKCKELDFAFSCRVCNLLSHSTQVNIPAYIAWLAPRDLLYLRPF